MRNSVIWVGVKVELQTEDVLERFRLSAACLKEGTVERTVWTSAALMDWTLSSSSKLTYSINLVPV